MTGVSSAGTDAAENSKEQSEAQRVAVVITHDNLPGLQTLVHALLPQARSAGIEPIVIASGPSSETRTWLSLQSREFRSVCLSENRGPGHARNAVLSIRGDADAYFFFDDDATLEGRELQALASALDSDETIGLVSGMPIAEDGTPLASSFRRRPFSGTLPGLWDEWWGPLGPARNQHQLEADVVGAGSIVVRGSAIRTVGGFDEVFWPGCHEDMDFCARLRFAGFRIVVLPELRIRQGLSTTMAKVFGVRHRTVCRATSVIYAAMDYPAPLAVGRLLEAALQSLLGSRSTRRGDADGLLRCVQSSRRILAGRRERRRLRARRDGAGLQLYAERPR